MTVQEKKLLIENQVVNLLLEEPTLFLVQIKIDAKNNIKVFLDGDMGITIGQCTSVNRALYPFIEENKLFPNDDFSLEVSSAGIDEPLTLERQYIKNIGRDLTVTTTDGSIQTGQLLQVVNNSIELEVKAGKGKKATINQVQIALADIKTAIVQIKF